MVKIEGNATAEVFGKNLGKKISINRYLQPDSKVDGFRFGQLESISKSKNGWFILVSYNDDCHHEGKKVSAYSLRFIADAIIHD